MTKQEQIVRYILEMWTKGEDETIRAWREHCLEDFIWWNSGRGAIEGLDACIKKIEGMHGSLQYAYLRVPVKNLLASGNIVMCERVDELYYADGSLFKAIPVTGVIEFAGDKIKEWRDYCDDWVLKMTLQNES